MSTVQKRIKLGFVMYQDQGGFKRVKKRMNFFFASHLTFIIWHRHQWLTRGKKVKSRREREIWKLFLQFWEEKEKSEFPFPSFEKRKRNQTKCSQLSRREREIRQNVLNFREEKEKSMFFAQASRVEREILNTCLQFREEKENIEEQIL